jgi:uncharacterized coiled-coil DUF342 family protein
MQNIKKENDEYKTHIKEIIDNQDDNNDYTNDKISQEIKSYKTKIDQKNKKIKNMMQQIDE